MKNNDLLKKYSTGQVYISPSAIEDGDSRLRTHFYCEGNPDQLIRDYVDHLLYAPTKRCHKLPTFNEDGVLNPGDIKITKDEMKWLDVEYKLREAINLARHRRRAVFVVVED